MPRLEIENVPEELMSAMARRAALAGISVEELAVRDLSLVEQELQSSNQLLAEIRNERDALAAAGVYLTEDILKEAKGWGRK